MTHSTVNVIALELLGGHAVRVAFDDGQQRERDLSTLLTGPIFAEIRSQPDSFAQVFVDAELGVICWPNGADIDAELLRYDDLWDAAVQFSQSA